MRDRGILCRNFFSQAPQIPAKILANLNFSDICSDDGIIALDKINLRLNSNFNLVTYMRLGAACMYFKRQLKHNRGGDVLRSR